MHSEGGRIDFTTPRSHNARGTTADKLYLDGGVAETDALLAELVPCMATSTDGEIIRA